MIIAVDVAGGDNAPGAILQGCFQAIKASPDIKLTLFGDPKIINEAVAKNKASKDNITVVEAPQIITNEESPIEAIRTKKNSSIVQGLNAVAAKQADVFVSAGSTGALLAGATLIIRRIPGVSRPGLAPLLPTANNKSVLLIDCGANIDCKPEHLRQFAIMGSAYMQYVGGVDEPRVGLLNNGAEEEKGNALTKAAYQLLKHAPLNFTGNAEARDALSGEFDVLVADGFAGNILLKAAEGFAVAFATLLKRHYTSGLRTKLGAMLSKPALAAFKRQLDYTEYGGAPLLGLNGGVIKAHGSSNAKAFCAAILQARSYALGDVAEKIRKGIEQLPQDGANPR